MILIIETIFIRILDFFNFKISNYMQLYARQESFGNWREFYKYGVRVLSAQFFQKDKSIPQSIIFLLILIKK